ncbi:hypothetical protein Tco_1359608 [Tanacetum coccineum]
MKSAAKDPLTFDKIIATPVDSPSTYTSSIELEYNMEECFKAFTDKLDWNNPEGDRCPFDLTKPLPLKGRPGRLIITVKYFFNNDLEFLKSSDPEKKYTTSITKKKETRYEIVGIEDIFPTLWSTTKVGVKVKRLHGYGHLDEIVLFQLDGNDIVDFIVSIRMFTRSLIIKRRVEDLQLGVESYQKKLNITEPHKTFPGIEFKELYTPSYKPPCLIYKDLNKQKRVMRADKLYKFSDETLKTVHDELHHRLLDFRLGYNDDMPRRKWKAMDRKRSGLMEELIDKQMRERSNLKSYLDQRSRKVLRTQKIFVKWTNNLKKKDLELRKRSIKCAEAKCGALHKEVRHTLDRGERELNVELEVGVGFGCMTIHDNCIELNLVEDLFLSSFQQSKGGMGEADSGIWGEALKLLNQEYVARIRGKLIQKLLLNQKCMGYLVRAYYNISPTKYYKDDSCWSADLKSNTTEDVISI